MQSPRVLIHEPDGRIARRFREVPKGAATWSVHEPRRMEDCIDLLGGPAVLIIRIGGDVESELDLMQRIAWRFPETACLAVAESDDPAVLGLAWDLGARHVLHGPGSMDMLPTLAAAFLNKANSGAPG
jgi:DNA-binding NarL/FixJ family response regulator